MPPEVLARLVSADGLTGESLVSYPPPPYIERIGLKKRLQIVFVEDQLVTPTEQLVMRRYVRGPYQDGRYHYYEEVP